MSSSGAEPPGLVPGCPFLPVLDPCPSTLPPRGTGPGRARGRSVVLSSPAAASPCHGAGAWCCFGRFQPLPLLPPCPPGCVAALGDSQSRDQQQHPSSACCLINTAPQQLGVLLSLVLFSFFFFFFFPSLPLSPNSSSSAQSENRSGVLLGPPWGPPPAALPAAG